MKNNDTNVTEKIETVDLTNDCTRVSVCLARWMKEEKGVECKIHLGAIMSIDGMYLTPHSWISIDGKITDITSMHQKDDTAQCVVHGIAVGKTGNGRRTSGYKIPVEVLDAYQEMPIGSYRGDNIVSALNALIKYRGNFKIPYEEAYRISTLDKVNYDDFVKNYPIPNALLDLELEKKAA